MDRKRALRDTAFCGFPLAIPPLTLSEGAAHSRSRFVPTSWDRYFDSRRTVNVGQDCFNIFEKGSGGPVLFLVHGGGFSALSWALFSDAVTKIVACRCVAMDLRGHGDTKTSDDSDLSAETLSNDVGHVMNALFGAGDIPPVILIGHSLGGAVCVHAAHRNLISNLVGLVVIDVVEGTALESLTSMESLVRGRPAKFPSLENAIEWSFRSGHIKNPDSACVSMIGQLRPLEASSLETSVLTGQTHVTDTILEDQEAGSVVPNNHHDPTQACAKFTWRIDLLKTQPFWLGWFKGLSEMFLACHVPKLLLLAGMDRLDKDLTIGQMQGKFQMVVLPKSGHAVQEDQPVKVAEALATFMVRNKFVQVVGDLAPIFPGC